MYRAGIRSMLGQLVRDDRLVVTQNLSVTEAKTKQLVDELKKLSLQSVLIVVEAQDEKLELAARNLPHVDVIDVAAINPLSLLSFDKVLMTVGAVKLIEERLQ
jgi:large subunit ribosomal protein L4